MTDENRERLRSKIFALRVQVDNLTELLKLNQMEPDVFLCLYDAGERIRDAMKILDDREAIK